MSRKSPAVRLGPPTFRIPRAHDDPSVGRVVLDLVNHLSQLIHTLPGVVVFTSLIFGAEMPPLESVYRSQITLPAVRKSDLVEIFSRSVSFPDVNIFFGQKLAIRRSTNEPEQFFDHPTQKDSFCREERQGPVGERESKGRRSKHCYCSGTSTIGTRLTIVDNVADEVEVLVFLVPW